MCVYRLLVRAETVGDRESTSKSIFLTIPRILVLVFSHWLTFLAITKQIELSGATNPNPDRTTCSHLLFRKRDNNSTNSYHAYQIIMQGFQVFRKIRKRTEDIFVWLARDRMSFNVRLQGL